MTLILCHAAKGGVGTTFIASQLALGMARRGMRVTAVDFTGQDSLKLHFGLLPSQFLPDLSSSRREPLAIADVSLINGRSERQEEPFRDSMRQGDFGWDDDQIVIADVAAGDRALFESLAPHADLHLSVLLPDPASLASLTQLGGGRPVSSMEKMVLVLNQLDDRRKLSRHTHQFIREVFGEQLIATVRRDEAVLEALANFETLSKTAPQSVVLPDLELLTDAVLAHCHAAGVDEGHRNLAATGGSATRRAG